MANLPELASSPAGLEVDHTASGLHHHVPPRYAPKDEYPLIDDTDKHALRSSPKICGIKRSTFFLVVILGAVIIAASVGGGVGGSIAVSNARSNAQSSNSAHTQDTATVTSRASDASNLTATPTSTATSTPTGSDAPYTPKAPVDVERIDNSCPSAIIQSSKVGNSAQDEYKCRDETDVHGNDIMWFTAYTLQACIDACTSYNRGIVADTKEMQCKGVSLNYNLTFQHEVNGDANCWLKTRLDQSEFRSSSIVTLAWLVNE